MTGANLRGMLGLLMIEQPTEDCGWAGFDEGVEKESMMTERFRSGSITLAERMGRLGTESAFDVLVKARALEAQGRSVVHLEIGEPDFDTPSHIIDAGVEALRSGQTHYTPAAGIPELRQAIADYIAQTRGVPCEAERVVVTPGGKPIMFFTILALVQAGDEVIYPDPGFPIYESVINFTGATPVPLTLREDRDFGFDVDELKSLV